MQYWPRQIQNFGMNNWNQQKYIGKKQESKTYFQRIIGLSTSKKISHFKKKETGCIADRDL